MTSLQEKIDDAWRASANHSEYARDINKAIQEFREQIKSELFDDSDKNNPAPRKEFSRIAWNEALLYVLALIGEKK